MNLGIEKIKGFSAITILGIIGGAIIPSFLFIFIYSAELFDSVDILVLCLIAPGITLPILIINSAIIWIGMISGMKSHDQQNEDRQFTGATYLGSLVSSLVIYSSIILGYFFKLETKTGVLVVLIAEFVAAIALLIMFHPRSSKRK